MTAPQTRRSPAAAGLRDRKANTTQRHHSASLAAIQSADPFELILSHAEGVKRLGADRAIFRAPTRADKTASVSLARGADGSVLMHDFGGDSAADVLAALGLSLASLYPARERRDMTPAERNELRTHAKFADWAAAVGVLHTEATVLECAAGLIARGEPLAPHDIERVRIASHRIHDCREVLR